MADINALKELSLDDFMRLRKLIHRGARPLDFTMWKYLFEDGNCEDFLSVLSSYQNEDGGFGYNIEANNWNPNSSPYTVCIAMDYLDNADDYTGIIKDKIVQGVVQYLASGAHFTENGWVGMQGVPTNNDFAHMPWFHYDPQKSTEADIGLTKRLSDFILKYADKNSDIYHKAEGLKAKYKQCGQTIINGVPDYDLTSFDPASFDPATWPSWMPLPVYYVGSPESGHYPLFKSVVEINLDTIVDSLRKINDLHIIPEEEIIAFEKDNPPPDGKGWGSREQTIGNYYWGAHFITTDMDVLRRFGRLDFQLPVRA